MCFPTPTCRPGWCVPASRMSPLPRTVRKVGRPHAAIATSAHGSRRQHGSEQAGAGRETTSQIASTNTGSAVCERNFLANRSPRGRPAAHEGGSDGGWEPPAADYLAVLEILDAAEGRIKAGRLEATGIFLAAAGALAHEVHVRPANGKPAESRQLLLALSAATRAKRVRRYEGHFVLTALGREEMQERGVHASARARELAGWAASQDADNLRREAGSRLAQPA